MVFHFRARFKYFLNDSCYVHGIRYLGNRCNIFGKIFWCTVLLLSMVGMTSLLKSTLNIYNNKSVYIQIENSGLDWIHRFPAISICLANNYNDKRMQTFMKEYLKQQNLITTLSVTKYSKFAQKYLFVNPSNGIDKTDYCEKLNKTCGINVDILQKILLPQTCSDILFDVTYLGRKFEKCEDIFKLYKTEMGQCFIANSLYSSSYKYNKLPLIFYTKTANRQFSFKHSNIHLPTTIKLILYIHGPDELPNISGKFTELDRANDSKIYDLYILETVNSNYVRDKSIELRKCRFPDERRQDSAFVYSFPSCITDIRISIELENCNCTIHTSPRKCNINLVYTIFKILTNYNIELKRSRIFLDEDFYCDYQGLLCINNLQSLKLAKDLITAGKTDCFQSCMEMELQTIGKEIEDTQNDGFGKTTINIVNVPRTRYLRKVAQTKLELVVSIAGVLGLFFGASILSFTEFIYIWFIRKF